MQAFLFRDIREACAAVKMPVSVNDLSPNFTGTDNFGEIRRFEQRHADQRDREQAPHGVGHGCRLRARRRRVWWAW